MDMCNNAPDFAFEVSLVYKAAQINNEVTVTAKSNSATCRTCVPNECPSAAVVKSALDAVDTFTLDCDCASKSVTVNFKSPFRNGDCEKTPVSRIFMFTDIGQDRNRKVAPRCQHTGQVNY
ncbi:hypothetical protein OEZ86_004098 [Tetradesmus obliquus]|nr:hypothetical protein OEZ86_004098 [Tetradesmus obliquus]